ncbi:MAG: hypothetical protein LC658_02195 [Bacteroidales bacterium]|nr:hypothetical protein [Bacteroidales bacterium]
MGKTERQKMYFSDYHLHKEARLRKSLLWEYNTEKIDWLKMRNIIVQRVIERGRPDDFYAILNKYSLEGVRQAIRQIPSLNRKDVSFVSTIFGINKSELKCCTTKRLKSQHWNS